MITESTLERWKKEALEGMDTPEWDEASQGWMIMVSKRVLCLIQELSKTKEK